jgi:Ca2+-binding RTX toxin-like protein
MRRWVCLPVLLGLVAGAAPAGAATFASVTVEHPEVSGGVAVFHGGPGDNDASVVAAGIRDVGSRWRDSLQPLVAGPGCILGPLGVDCTTPRVDAYLEKGNDRIKTIGSGGDGSDLIFVDGGPGKDQIYANAGTTASHGGTGNDSVSIYTNSGSLADGGDGDDRLAGFGNCCNRLVGGDGGDLLVGEFSTFLLDGGPKDDILVEYSFPQFNPFGQPPTLSGGSGHDVLVAKNFGGWTLDGGPAGDWIIGPRETDPESVGSVTVAAGEGNDDIDVSGNPASGPDVVHCGASTDTVYANPQDILDADCEHRRSGPMPESERVTEAIRRADAWFGVAWDGVSQ